MSDLVAANAVIGNLYRAIGAHLAEARRQCGVRQGDLADAVGLTRSSITNIERGTQRIQVHTLIAVAQCLGLDPADVISRALDGQPPVAGPMPYTESRDAAVLVRRLSTARDQITALLDHLTQEET